MRPFFLFFLCSVPPFLGADNPTLQVPQSSLMEIRSAFENGDEIRTLDTLIASTTKQLETQKQLKKLMLQFREQQEAFVQGEESKTLAGQMVRTARQIHELITANHIEHLFPKDYLDELNFFSSIAGKNKISKP